MRGLRGGFSVALAAALAAGAAGCEYGGPTLDGTWEGEAWSQPGEGYWVLALRQDGEDISGVACHVNGHRVYGDREVVGRHPYVFVPYASDADLIVKIDDEDTLKVTLRGDSLGSFRRVDPARYEDCMSTPPAPEPEMPSSIRPRP
jgi:hypothetical protein